MLTFLMRRENLLNLVDEYEHITNTCKKWNSLGGWESCNRKIICIREGVRTEITKDDAIGLIVDLYPGYIDVIYGRCVQSVLVWLSWIKSKWEKNNMKIECIFTSKEHFEELSNKSFERIVVNSKDKSERTISINPSVVEYSNGTWLLTLEVNGENADSAKTLSAFLDELIHYSPFIIKDGASEYYNRSLYPLINRFERELRRLLYTKAAFGGDGEILSTITTLESLDFGKIHDLLFRDQKFNKKTKSTVKDYNGLFTKQEIIAEIEKQSEELIWDKIVDEDELTSIREDFWLIKEYRNDVMHAHRIRTDRYNNIRKIFDNANKEMETITNKLLNVVAFDEKSLEMMKTMAKVLAESICQYERNRDEINKALENFANTVGQLESNINENFIRALTTFSNTVKDKIDEDE